MCKGPKMQDIKWRILSSELQLFWSPTALNDELKASICKTMRIPKELDHQILMRIRILVSHDGE